MANNHWKEALILGGTSTALGFTRSLGKKGVAVTVMASSSSQPGMHSKWGIPLVGSDPITQPEACFDQLIKWGKGKKKKSVLIPTLEEYVKILSEFRQELDRHFLFRIPPAQLPGILQCRRPPDSRVYIQQNPAAP